MKFGIIGNIAKEMVREVVPQLIRWLQARNISFILAADLHEFLNLSREIEGRERKKLGELCDAVLAFGGDGTMLLTARELGRSGVPILGVNLGGLGFLAEVVLGELYQNLEEILAGNYKIIERMVLEAAVTEDQKVTRFYGLNDVVIHKGGFPGVIQIATFTNEEFLNTYVSDGLIISTPTGSTAYSLSAGGPIINPSVNAMIISPICPHSLGARPVVIPDDMEVRVVATSGSPQIPLSADGQMACYLQSGQNVRIRKADYKVKWIRPKGKSFYDILRTKLNWGEDFGKCNQER